MRQFWQQSWRKALACTLMLAITLSSGFVEAKRMGSGRSMGKQSQNIRQNNPPAAPAAQKTSDIKSPTKSGLGSMLGGIAAGLGLGMLLSHFGGSAMLGGVANILMIVAAIGLVFWLLRKMRKTQNSEPEFSNQLNHQPLAYASHNFEANRTTQNPTKTHVQNLSKLEIEKTESSTNHLSSNNSNASNNSSSLSNLPEDFDLEDFLRLAKVHFIRMQAAWDAGDLQDIREFTTIAMFAEIQEDFLENKKDNTDNHKTEILLLKAQLLGIEQMHKVHIASVQFSGTLRETKNADPESFVEIWNLEKSSNSGWVLAGIEQSS